MSKLSLHERQHLAAGGQMFAVEENADTRMYEIKQISLDGERVIGPQDGYLSAVRANEAAETLMFAGSSRPIVRLLDLSWMWDCRAYI